jgi:hypothetical protein
MFFDVHRGACSPGPDIRFYRKLVEKKEWRKAPPP